MSTCPRGQFLAGFGKNTQRARHEAGFCFQRHRGVETDHADFPGHERAVGKAGILRSVRNHRLLAGEEDFVAHRVVPRAHTRVHAPGPDLVLMPRADDVDDAKRGLTQLCCEPDKILHS